MKSRGLLPVFILSLGISFSAVSFGSDEPQDSSLLGAESPMIQEEADVLVSCFDSYDCISTVEHCLNRRCERTTRPCHFNYECGGADTCRRGVCRR